MFGNFRFLFLVLALILIAGSAYTFSAQNTIADSAAGYKASVVPGYTVTNIVYDLNATDSTLVDAIKFDIAPTSGTVVAATVKVQTANGGAWTDCALTAGRSPSMSVTCTYGSLQLADVTVLNIVASSTDPAP